MLVVVLVSSASWFCSTRAEADVRRTTPRAHFKSGAARSEKILREILAQLKKTDARLAKIEAFVVKVDQITKPQPKPRDARSSLRGRTLGQSANRARR